MTKPANIPPIEQATNRPWPEWTAWLESRNARNLEHKAIAELVYYELESKVDNPGWWAQGVTVAYEQQIGRRVPGQRVDGTFDASLSRTFPVEREALFERAVALLNDKSELNGLAVSNARTSVTPVRSYWKCELADGSKVAWLIEGKGAGRASVTVQHLGLPGKDEATRWKEYWRGFIEKNID